MEEEAREEWLRDGGRRCWRMWSGCFIDLRKARWMASMYEEENECLSSPTVSTTSHMTLFATFRFFISFLKVQLKGHCNFQASIRWRRCRRKTFLFLDSTGFKFLNDKHFYCAFVIMDSIRQFQVTFSSWIIPWMGWEISFGKLRDRIKEERWSFLERLKASLQIFHRPLDKVLSIVAISFFIPQSNIYVFLKWLYVLKSFRLHLLYTSSIRLVVLG